jgi:hypothetical protein
LDDLLLELHDFLLPFNLETSVDRLYLSGQPDEDWPCAFEMPHPWGNRATQLPARLVGRPALSLLLAGTSLLRRRFAPAIPPWRTISRVQLKFQGSNVSPAMPIATMFMPPS